MDFEKIKKKYLRFLKENGVCDRAIRIHCKGGKTLNSVLNAMHPEKWISSITSFCVWKETEEGILFWYGIHLLWKYECVKHEGVYAAHLLEREIAEWMERVNNNKVSSAFVKLDLKKKIEKILNKL